MSAITRAIQHAQMVKDIESLKKIINSLLNTVGSQELAIVALHDRIAALEQKRGPGRPKNEDRKQAE